MTTHQIAKIFGCTEDQVRAQFLANANQLAKMRAKAVKTGKKVNGYTAAELRCHASNTFAKAVA